MDLECQIEAYPPPAIEWYRDNILLNNNQHYRISHFPFDDEHTNTILRVITIEKKQYANYTCKATNIYGQKEGMYAEKKIFFFFNKKGFTYRKMHIFLINTLKYLYVLHFPHLKKQLLDLEIHLMIKKI